MRPSSSALLPSQASPVATWARSSCAAFDAQQDLVAGLRRLHDGADLLAQGGEGRGAEIALEIQEIDAGLGDIRFRLRLVLGLVGLLQGLARLLGQARRLDAVAHGFQLAVQIRHLDLAATLGFLFADGDQAANDDQDGHDDGGGIGEEEGVVTEEVFHGCMVHEGRG